MFAGLRNVMRPAAFHGHGRAAPFFEGWYFKLVTADRSRAFAVIPGVYYASDPSESHCFVQFFDGMARRAHYIRYPIDAFWAHQREFEVRVGPNRFGRDRIQLDLTDSGVQALRCEGSVDLEGVVGWPITRSAPGVMGFFAWIPFMECYHGVIGLDHGLRGALEINGERHELDGGRGYTEKDWGKSFPRCWLWSQCNHFSTPNTSLSASIAEIPNLGRVFPGFIVGLWHQGVLHQFTTYKRSRIERLDFDAQRVHWTLRNKTHRLAIVLHRSPTTVLPGPTLEGMKLEVRETLEARAEVELTRLADGEVVVRDTGACAGLEVQGEVSRLQRTVRP